MSKSMKNKKMFSWFMFFLCFIVLNAQSQSNLSINQFILHTCYNRFWQSDSTSFLEIATAFYPNQVILTKDSIGYHGSIELRITIQKKSSGTLIHADRYMVPVHILDTASVLMTKSIVSKIIYQLELGSYSIAVYGFNSSNRSRCDSSLFIVNIEKRPSTSVLSDIELSTNISESSDRKDPFYKNSYRVVPNPSLVFGSIESPTIFSYAEMYNLHKGSVYLIKVQVVDSKNRILKHRTRAHKFLVTDAVDITTLNITSLSSGKYKYQYIISDTLGNGIAQGEKVIYIYNPQVQQESVASTSAKSTEFAGMTDDELTDEMKKIQYIATNEDIKMCAKLTGVEARRDFLSKFWTDVESGNRNRSDLTRAIYLQRIISANERFRVMGKEGWKTDRGRIYILYTEPDEIQRFPSSGDSKPYEIWNYYSIESGVQFIFVDRSGFGNYVLVHSTKRGELQDEEWERNLR
jgi:GWxTD domain-containing protein